MTSPPRLPPSGAHVDNPVRHFDDIQIMLNDDHSIACVDQSLQDFDKHAHVFGVQANRWLVKHVNGLARGTSREFLGQFDALRFSTA